MSLSGLTWPIDCRRRSFVMLSFFGRDELGLSSICRVGSSCSAAVVVDGGTVEGSRLVSLGAGGAGVDC